MVVQWVTEGQDPYGTLIYSFKKKPFTRGQEGGGKKKSTTRSTSLTMGAVGRKGMCQLIEIQLNSIKKVKKGFLHLQKRIVVRVLVRVLLPACVEKYQ